MSINPTMDKLQSLRFYGMAGAYKDQLQQPDISSLSFDERLALLVEREVEERENRRLATRLRKAKLKHAASMEDIDYQHPRGLNRLLLQQLAGDRWIKAKQNILIVGPTGTGKTYLACAIAQKACLQGHSVHYTKFARLLPDLVIAKGDGRYTRYMKELCKYDVLILDDWGMMPMTSDHRRDLLELLDERHDNRSTIVTSQYPVKTWHEKINDDTMADAILDRLVHNANRIELVGESMRKLKGQLTQAGNVDINTAITDEIRG